MHEGQIHQCPLSRQVQTYTHDKNRDNRHDKKGGKKPVRYFLFESKHSFIRYLLSVEALFKNFPPKN
jgi:hypothetical protein